MKKFSYDLWRVTKNIKKDCAYRMFFRAFSNPSRFSILKLLSEGRKNVSEICESLGLEQTLVSHHLRCLRECGFVIAERDGKSIFYSINPETEKLVSMIDRHVDEYLEKMMKCGVINV